MSWVSRLGRMGGLAAMAGVSGCGRTIMQAARPDSAEAAPVCSGALVPRGLTVAFAGTTDSTSGGGAVPDLRVLLTEIAAALPPMQCAAGNATLPPIDDTVTARQIRDADARDVLDQGSDVLVTRDHAVAAYALARPGLTVLALPWDRIYVLVVARRPSHGDSAVTQLRSTLAADADRADARPFVEVAGPAPADACGADLVHQNILAALTGGARRMPDAGQVVYDAKDIVARFLAERVAYFASTRSGPFTRVVPALDPKGTEMSVRGLPSDALRQALLDGSAAAYIVAIPSGSRPCDPSHPAPAASASSGLTPGEESPGIVPLIETRAVAIVRLDAATRITTAARGDHATLVPARQP
jgi:hypothetical protein